MNFRISKAYIIIFGLFCILGVSWSVYRDIQLRKQFPGDLRNRVVGSRLQMDGISPYFYHWKPSDGLRYYDWNNGNNRLEVSNITATPFFHQLISPVAGFSQYNISIIWLVLCYLMLIVMVILAFRLCQTGYQQAAVLFIAVLFLFSYAWTGHVVNGQMYLVIPFLSFGFYFILASKPLLINGMFAGVLAASLVLVRPTTIIFLVPFLLVAKNFNLKYKLSIIMPALFLFLVSFATSPSREYWNDYRLAVQEHVKAHQTPDAVTGVFHAVPTINKWEGWDMEKIIEAQKFPYYKNNDANGNVFVFINHILHLRTPVWLLTVMCLVSIGLFSFMFYKSNTAVNLSLYSVAILAFLLYMLTDLFSPVHRFQYNASQWIFPLLLTASGWRSRMNKLFVLGVPTGIVLNSLPFSMFRMQHSIGEYIVFFSLAALLLTNKTVLSR
ncbi:MAG: DUF2029 domain-containing protein [Chitinophagaceae bacterium]|nr:MAG: DUF2029 domain-containing protein [Chitinophagaceae bacterium]